MGLKRSDFGEKDHNFIAHHLNFTKHSYVYVIKISLRNDEI